MRYRIVKYKKKRKLPFDTYEPKKRIEVNPENVVPMFVRLCNRFVFLGGMMSFFASSFLLSVRGIFKANEKRLW